MENASKALIIAGAILLSIAIIGIGMFVFNRAASTTQGSVEQLDVLEREAFNGQFTGFEGRVKGTEVRSLVNKVIASNAAYPDRKVEITGDNKWVTMGSGDANAEYGTDFANSRSYTVTLTYGNASDTAYNGIVKSIKVEGI